MRILCHSALVKSALLTILVFTILVLAGCAKTSPQFETPLSTEPDGKSAKAIFIETFERHGGNHLKALTDVNLAIDGHWYYLISKIQPEVTDEAYRHLSEERLILSPKVYSVIYEEKAGTKQVFRTPDEIEVAYNGDKINDSRKETATALTADAFYQV